MKSPEESITGRFLPMVENTLRSHGHEMLALCQGRLLAPDSGGLAFRLMYNDAQAGGIFSAYLGMFAEMAAPLAFVWPMRITGQLATATTQTRYLAVCIKLMTGYKYAVLDAGKPLEWLDLNHPRLAPIVRLMDAFKMEGSQP